MAVSQARDNSYGFILVKDWVSGRTFSETPLAKTLALAERLSETTLIVKKTMRLDRSEGLISLA